jgi:hypothetical protein
LQKTGDVAVGEFFNKQNLIKKIGRIMNNVKKKCYFCNGTLIVSQL